MSGSYTEKLQTPGSAKEHAGGAKQTKPTLLAINPNNRQPAQLTDQAPGTIERAPQESSRMKPTSTVTAHVSSAETSTNHQTDPAGSPPESSQPTQPSAQRRRAEPH